MAGAFLLPALSPEDGIPVVQAGSCSAALHCDEFSTDVFLLSLLSTLPVLLFSPACLQPWCSRFLNMCSTFVLLFFYRLTEFMCALSAHFLLVCVCVRGYAHLFLPCCICSYYSYEQTTMDLSGIISTTAVKIENESLYIFRWGVNESIQF